MRAPLYGLAFVTAFVTNLKHQQDQPREERGAAFTEYVVLIAVMTAIVIALLWVLQEPLKNAIDAVGTALGTAGTDPTP
jgi:Flp pilus assembly pilin Flp